MSTQSKTILLADDEPNILEILSYNLSKEGFTVYTAKNGSEAITRAQALLPDIIILDVMMPNKTGLEVCSILRSQPNFAETPIIILTAVSDEHTHIKGLELGADDFINKPISPKVLVSRVKNLFRRTQAMQLDNIIEIDGIIINSDKYIVTVNNETIILAKKEFELLKLLASKPGKVFLRDEILSLVWGNDVIVGDRTIDVHVRKIRQKMNVDCISTVKGVGYKFEV